MTTSGPTVASAMQTADGMGEPVHVSFVIPAYNEERRIGATLSAMTAYFAGAGYPAEIVVVDDGSTDGTAPLVHAEFPAVRVVRYEPNRGKGYAVREGIRHSRGRYLFFYDADGSTPITELAKVWPRFDAGADIVIGSRSLPDSDVQVHQNRLRETMGRTFNLLVKTALNEPLIDTQCGFKGFTRRAADIVFPRQRMKRFSFDSELLFIARKHGLRVVDVPVVWLNSRDSRVHIIRDSLRMMRDLVRIRFNDACGHYA